MRSALAVVASAALAAGACSFVPRYERPPAPVAAAFPVAGSPAAGAAAEAPAALRGWRSVLGDPWVVALVERALQHNRDLRIAALTVEVARATYQIESAARWPTVAGVGSAELSATADGGAVRARVGLGTSAFELDLFGRVRALREAALADYLATAAARQAVHIALVAEVATQALRERAAAEQHALAKQTLEVAERSAELTRRLVEGGQRSELDAATAEAQVAGSRAAVAQAARARAQARNALELLVGQPLPEASPPEPALAESAVDLDVPPGLPSELLERRPDLMAAEQALRAANADVGAARAARFPTLSLTGFAGLASTALTSLVTSGAAVASVTPQLAVPLLDGGRGRAGEAAARARLAIEVARYERAIQVAFREVADALVARAALAEQLAAQLARVAAEQRRLALSEVRYQNGAESFLAVITAQQALFAAQQQLIELRLARLTNAVALYRALGGGWRAET
jgi:multidrug efflux system outer membrane protein